MPACFSLTRDEFQTIYDAGPDATYALFQSLLSHIAALEARVKALEDRLSKDSRTSGKPPSSDGLGRKPKSLRETSGKPTGGQPGHPGKTLEPSDTPDHRIVHAPTGCGACGGDLSDAETVSTERRQVFDLPPLALEVTEHRVETRRCRGCGALCRGRFPDGVTQPVQYGPGVKALGVYLQTYHLLPFARTHELMDDLFGAAPSEGTLAEGLQACASRLSDTEAAIRAALAQARVVHFDETGLRIEGQLQWLHSASTTTLSHFSAQPKRGQAGMDRAGVLPGFTGVAVHDGWASYFAYDCDHALCNAHHLRELTFLEERHAQAWATDLKSLLVEMKTTVEAALAAGQAALGEATRQSLVDRYDALLEVGEATNPLVPPDGVPRRGRKKQTPARNLLSRLRKHREATLAFLKDFSLPFDNNFAEREIRMVKVQQKVSGGFRSQVGAEAFCRIRGYIATARKQAHPVFFALRQVFLGQPLSLTPNT